ncbi:hypothetical protein [Pedobacter panaciterrae]
MWCLIIRPSGDELEKIKVRKVNDLNRKEFISPVIEIEAWTKFTFPGRKGKYSSFIWDYHCFSGLDFAANLQEGGIFQFRTNLERVGKMFLPKNTAITTT